MATTLYEVSIPVFIKHLNTLEKLLDKGVAYAAQEGNGIMEEELITSRLIADMGDLIYQVQRVTDTAKGLAVRMGKVEPVVLEDVETTFVQLHKRIQTTIAILEKVDAATLNSQGDKEVVIVGRNSETKMIGKNYVLEFAVPNFYFHFVTAYAILRMRGVGVGKSDYLGRK